MVRKEQSMRKSQSVQFRYANTFFFRSACRLCGSGPTTAYFVHNKDVSFENFRFMMKRVRDFGKGFYGHNSYGHSDSKIMTRLVATRQFKVAHLFDRDTIFYRSIFVPNSKFEPNKDSISCRVECECGKTCWAFTNSRRLHIINRKSSKILKVPSDTNTL